MRPTIKTKKSKPPSKGQTPRGFPRSGGSSPTPGRRPQFSRTSTKPAAKGPAGLIGRAQASLPGRKPASNKSAVKGALSSLGSAKSSAVARKPSKKGLVGIVAGGLGVAIVAKRRRGAVQDETPATPPVGPPEASAAEGSLVVPSLRPVEPSAAGDSPPTTPPLQPAEPGAEDISPAN